MAGRDPASPDPAPPDPGSFAGRLLRWFDAHRRDLPWRRTRDPWAIWVSEVMLQQTRAEVVRDRYPGFLARFPTPRDLAAAGDDALHTAWAGLGYYRRVRLLRDGARAVVERHAGRVPDTVAALAALPGIGRYTSGAIASIAFDRPAVAVDGNVERVLARHRGIETDVKRRPGATAVAEAAARQQDPRRPGDFNQALMELGATLCTPRRPRCGSCPVAGDCVARAAGTAERLPVLPPRRAAVAVLARTVLVETRPGTLLARRVPAGQANAGQLDLPGPGPLVEMADAAVLQAWLSREAGLRCTVGPEVARVRHGITHHRITLVGHAGRVHGPLPEGGWVHVARDDAGAPWTTAARKLFAQAARRQGAE